MKRESVAFPVVGEGVSVRSMPVEERDRRMAVALAIVLGSELDEQYGIEGARAAMLDIATRLESGDALLSARVKLCAGLCEADFSEVECDA